MLQEAVRTAGVPPTAPAGARAAKWIGPDTGEAIDIDDAARVAGLSLLYVPSMRNGQASARGAASDRGNAILSTLPLSEPVAIELPGTRQRRVAIEARIVINTTAGMMTIAVGSAHLNVLGSARTLWVFSAASTRAEQARTLIRALAADPMILGADLNSWQGSDEPAARTLIRSFPSTPAAPRASTFRGGLVLDHVFFRLPGGWRARIGRAAERYGADHYPLIGWLSSGASTQPSTVCRNVPLQDGRKMRSGSCHE
jgi:endonuclease/exonuclease/phosphatase family metal-dependent hydrolase